MRPMTDMKTPTETLGRTTTEKTVWERILDQVASPGGFDAFAFAFPDAGPEQLKIMRRMVTGKENRDS